MVDAVLAGDGPDPALRELTGLHPARADDRERFGLGIKAQLVLDALAQVR